MFGISIPAEAAPWVALAILAVMFVLFVLERTPVEVTAIGGAALMLMLGILPVKAATEVLAASPLDHRDDVPGDGRAGQDRGGRGGGGPGHAACGGPAKDDSVVDPVDRAGLGLHEQHAAGGGDDPGGDAAWR